MVLNHGSHRSTQLVRHLDGSELELTDVPIHEGTSDVPADKPLRLAQIEAMSAAERGTLLSLCYDIFVARWREVRFGPCIEGAVFELELTVRPDVFSMLDGYLTVIFPPGPAHFHLCIGPTRGLATRATPEALAVQRRCHRAAFMRSLSAGACTPGSWGLRFWNGLGEQMLSVFLPSPLLDDQLKPQRDSDCSRLALWNELRARYLGETEPQALPASSHRRALT
jgi:hypothetical protein